MWGDGEVGLQKFPPNLRVAVRFPPPPPPSPHQGGAEARWLSGTPLVRPGLVGLDGHDLEKELGYIPKNVRILNGNCLYSKSCKMWHVPSSNYRKSNFDRKQRMWGDCLVCERYVKSALDNRQSLDATKREDRRNPRSNYPIQFLSPKKQVPSSK